MLYSGTNRLLQKSKVCVTILREIFSMLISINNQVPVCVMLKYQHSTCSPECGHTKLQKLSMSIFYIIAYILYSGVVFLLKTS